MLIRVALFLMLLPLIFTGAFAASIQSTEACTATLGLPTCFPHDGLIDWSITPGVGSFGSPPLSGTISGTPGIDFTITGPWSLWSSGGGPSFPPGTVDLSANGGTDRWARWAFRGGVDILFSQPVEGVALRIATTGEFDMAAYNSSGTLLEVNQDHPLSGILFMGIERTSADISRIHLDPFLLDENPGMAEMFSGSIQIQSSAEIPEPMTWWLTGVGLLLVAKLAHHRNR